MGTGGAASPPILAAIWQGGRGGGQHRTGGPEDPREPENPPDTPKISPARPPNTLRAPPTHTGGPKTPQDAPQPPQKPLGITLKNDPFKLMPRPPKPPKDHPNLLRNLQNHPGRPKAAQVPSNTPRRHPNPLENPQNARWGHPKVKISPLTTQHKQAPPKTAPKSLGGNPSNTEKPLKNNPMRPRSAKADSKGMFEPPQDCPQAPHEPPQTPARRRAAPMPPPDPQISEIPP